MIEKIKKNWKNILFVLLIIFGMNKCTQSCNRAGQIDELVEAVRVQDSIIVAQGNQVEELVRDTVDYLNQIRMYQKFGNTQSEYIRQRNITDSIQAVNAAKQKAQTDRLIEQNRRLIEQQRKEQDGKENK